MTSYALPWMRCQCEAVDGIWASMAYMHNDPAVIGLVVFGDLGARERRHLVVVGGGGVD